MKITFAKAFNTRKTSDCLIVPFIKSGNKVEKAASFSLPSSYKLPISNKDFKAKPNEVLLMYLNASKEKRVLFLGLGIMNDITLDSIRWAYAEAIRECMKKGAKRISIILPQIEDMQEQEVLFAASEGLLSGNYAYHRLMTAKDKLERIEAVQFIGVQGEKSCVDKAMLIADGVHFARDLVNNNADDETPHHLTQVAQGLKKLSKKVSVKIFDKKWLVKEKMGLILAVSRGASVDPYLIQVDYRGAPSSDEHTVIVGKGVTYDTGGLSLKPTVGMDTMKADMSGGAAILGAMYSLCQLDLPINVTALVPTVENAIGPNSYKPGDVYFSYSGKSVEVTNTDAEGRLILADALYYAAKNLKPTRIVDIASLTGAMVVALGDDIAGLFSNNDVLAQHLLEAADQTGELLCRMPLYKGYKKLLKSQIADIMNAAKVRHAGSITASLFLEEFVNKLPWAHIDIAGPNFLAQPNRYHPIYGTGYGVRLFIELFHRLIKNSK